MKSGTSERRTTIYRMQSYLIRISKIAKRKKMTMIFRLARTTNAETKEVDINSRTGPYQAMQ